APLPFSLTIGTPSGASRETSKPQQRSAPPPAAKKEAATTRRVDLPAKVSTVARPTTPRSLGEPPKAGTSVEAQLRAAAPIFAQCRNMDQVVSKFVQGGKPFIDA